VRLHLHADAFDGKIDPKYSIYGVRFGFWSEGRYGHFTNGSVEYKAIGFKSIFDRIEPMVQSIDVALAEAPNPRYFDDLDRVRKCIDSLKKQIEPLADVGELPPTEKCERKNDVHV
jgi:hypothetical protein